MNPRPTTRTLLVLSGLLLLWAGGAARVAHWFLFSEEHLPDLRLSRPVCPPATDRLVVVLADSVPFEMAFDPRLMPNISALRARGTWGMAWTAEPTMTSLMINTILTGNWPYVWDVLRDWHMQPLPHETWVDGLARAGLRVVAYGDIPWLEQVGNRLAAGYGFAEEGKMASGWPIHWHSKLLDLSPRVYDAALRAAMRQDWDVFIWHIVSTDQIMHLRFRDSPETAALLRYADAQIRDVLDFLDDGRTAFLLLSDHGCAANGRHGTSDPEARRSFWLLFGRGVRAAGRQDVSQTDLGPTLLALFGLSPNAPASGHPVLEALDQSKGCLAHLAIQALRQRLVYLRAKARRGQPTGPLARWERRLPALKALLATGKPGQAAAAAIQALAALESQALAARRASQIPSAVLWWFALGLALLAAWAALAAGLNLRLWEWAALAVAAAGPWIVPHGLAALASAGAAGLLLVHRRPHRPWPLAGLVLLATAYLTGVTLLHLWTGRICNSLLFAWTKRAEFLFVQLVDFTALAGLILLYLLRRRILPSAERHPVAWALLGVVVLAASNGYYQGFYFPFVTGLLLLALLRSALTPPRTWQAMAVLIPPLAACAWIFFWQTTWDRHFYWTRYWLDAHATEAGLLASLGLLAAGLSWRLTELPKNPRRFWLLTLLTAGLILARHLAWPSPAEQYAPSLGASLWAALPAQAVFLALLALAGLALAGRDLASWALVLTAAVVLAGSPFEGLVGAILAALLAPFARHEVFRGPLAALAGAFFFLASRVMLHVAFDFKFNFTTIHDVMGFPAAMPLGLWLRSLPILLLRYLLPTLLAAWLALRTLEADQRNLALGLIGLFLTARILYIVILGQLSHEQLYLNWRNMGEAIHYGLWLASLPVALLLLEAPRRLGARRGKCG